tara:strand:+ start:237 stop:695 length:459 start_codon:yes stop_codon:yes gene_type:complete
MKNKFAILYIVFFFLSSCGFNPIFSSKNMVVSIGKIEAENTQLNSEISKALKQISLQNQLEKKIDIRISSEKNILIKSKDKSGDPKIFELVINLEIEILNPSYNNFKKEFIKRISYKNDDDKFKLSEYQKELESSFVKELVMDIINFLSSLE